VELQRQYGISPSGEGGEIETTVIDAPMFKQKIEILNSSMESKGNCGVFQIKQARLVPK
jgi:diphthamide synthase (EF-2-diphthine--ammonia ligase)